MALAASAADVRSILSIPESSSGAGPSQPQQKKQAHLPPKKPEGISRELYSLIGPSVPSLQAQLQKPKFKQKPKFGGGSKVKWELRPFKNGSRKDSLELKHWVKASEPGDTEYPFAKYDVHPNAFIFNQEEYTRFLEDKEWTQDESAYLMNIVQEYDLRWYVVHDRYNYVGGKERSIEDLKDRYFSICRKLIRNRPWDGDEASKTHAINNYLFDKDREELRKKYIANLENRTAEELAEEEALYVEYKRLEQTERKFRKERDDLLRILAGVDSGLPDVQDDENGIANLSVDAGSARKKFKKAGLDMDSPSTPIAPLSVPQAVKRPQTAKNAAFDAANCIIRIEQPNTASATKAAHGAAHLRSYKIPVPKAAHAPKISAALAEIGVNPNRLVMPTRDNILHLESLIEATTALVETKKLVDKVEYDIRVVKGRLGIPDENEASNEGDAMAVDEAEEPVGEDGRGASVLSARSGSARGRKQARRSMSISSVDTSGTTRAGTKRQKRS